MITTYKLENNKWFKRLYNLKEKWATALSKDFFSSGILSSQRSESSNRAVGFRDDNRTTLIEFFHIFEDTMIRWRRSKIDDEFHCTKSVPNSHMPLIGLLEHASEVYTETLIRDFENEFTHAMVQ